MDMFSFKKMLARAAAKHFARQVVRTLDEGGTLYVDMRLCGASQLPRSVCKHIRVLQESEGDVVASEIAHNDDGTLFRKIQYIIVFGDHPVKAE